MSTHVNKGKIKGIASDQRHLDKILLATSIITCVISVLAYDNIVEAINDGKKIFWLFALFPIASVAAFVKALQAFRRMQRFGRTPLFLDPVGGQIGGQLGGYFTSKRRITSDVIVTVTCTRHVSGRDQDDSDDVDIIWQDKSQAYVSKQEHGIDVQFVINIPEDQPETGKEGRTSFRWTVTCEGQYEHGGKTHTFSRTWRVPLSYGGLISDLNIPVAHFERAKNTVYEQSVSSVRGQIDTQFSEDGFHIVSHNQKNRIGTAVPSIIGGAVFFSAGVFWLPADAPIVVRMAFTIIGFAIFAFGVFWLGRKLESHMSGNHVICVRYLFGLRLFKREGQLSAPEQISIDKSISVSSNQSVSAEYFNIVATLDHSHKKIKVVEGIEGRSEASVLLDKIQTQLQTKTNSSPDALDDELL